MTLDFHDPTEKSKMNKERDYIETFSAFTKFVNPLISDHPEPCFDDLLACWMSKEIERQYSRWKSNEGRIKHRSNRSII